MPKCELFDAKNHFNYILGKLTYLEKETKSLYLKKWHFEMQTLPSLPS